MKIQKTTVRTKIPSYKELLLENVRLKEINAELLILIEDICNLASKSLFERVDSSEFLRRAIELLEKAKGETTNEI